MTTTIAIALAALASILTAYATVWVARRQNSGLIETTDAEKLWDEATQIRQDLRRDVEILRERIDDLEERVREAERKVKEAERKEQECAKREAELAARVRDLEQAIPLGKLLRDNK